MMGWDQTETLNNMINELNSSFFFPEQLRSFVLIVVGAVQCSIVCAMLATNINHKCSEVCSRNPKPEIQKYLDPFSYYDFTKILIQKYSSKQ